MRREEKVLGERYSSARARLAKSVLVKLALDAGYTCYRCGKTLSEKDFSIDHKKPWLWEADPVKSFFDLDNIAFSHLSCNQLEMISRKRKYITKEDVRVARNAAKRKRWDAMTPEQRTEFRRNQYRKYEKRVRSDVDRQEHKDYMRRWREKSRGARESEGPACKAVEADASSVHVSK